MSRRYGEVETDGGAKDAFAYIKKEFIEEFVDNMNRHELGIGLIGKCLGLKRKEKISADVQEQLNVIDDKNYRQVFVSVVTYSLLFIGCVIVVMT